MAAAVSYATAPQTWLYLSDEQVTASARAVTVPEARDELVPRLVEEVRLLRDELRKASGTVWFVVAPLATRVETYGDEPGHGAGVGGAGPVRRRGGRAPVGLADPHLRPGVGRGRLAHRRRWTRPMGPPRSSRRACSRGRPDYLEAELDGFRRVGAS